MAQEEVMAKVKDIIVKHFEVDPDSITESTSIKDDLDADSISIMEFVLDLEDAFEAEISDEDAEKITTVGAAVEYIVAHG